MTWCVGPMLDRGLVMMADTRTDAGVDNISTFRKLFTREVPGERVLMLMTAGNLATARAVVGLLDERSGAAGEHHPSILAISAGWGEALRSALDSLPDFDPGAAR